MVASRRSIGDAVPSGVRSLPMTADSVGQSRFERPPPLATIAPQPKRAAMTISMYQASVPVLVRALTNLKGILNKAAAHAQAKKIDEAALQNALPNFFFHVTTAYAILRHSGIDIGKADYIGALD